MPKYNRNWHRIVGNGCDTEREQNMTPKKFWDRNLRIPGAEWLRDRINEKPTSESVPYKDFSKTGSDKRQKLAIVWWNFI